MVTIKLFKDRNFGGPSRVLHAAEASLYNLDFNDEVSSIIVIEGEWELYRDVNYEGPQWGPVTPTGGPQGNGLYPDSTDWKADNDNLSSLKPTS